MSFIAVGQRYGKAIDKQFDRARRKGRGELSPNEGAALTFYSTARAQLLELQRGIETDGEFEMREVESAGGGVR